MTEKKIRIAIIAPYSVFFGSEKSLLSTLDSLDRSRFESLLITLHEGPLEAVVREIGVDVVRLPWLDGARTANPFAAQESAA